MFSRLNQKNRNVLHLACIGGEVGVAKALLQYLDPESETFDVNAVDNEGMTPLDCAIQMNRDDLVKALIDDRRVDVNLGGKSLHSSFNFAVSLLKEDYVE